jgi:hypothetical protein
MYKLYDFYEKKLIKLKEQVYVKSQLKNARTVSDTMRIIDSLLPERQRQPVIYTSDKQDLCEKINTVFQGVGEKSASNSFANRMKFFPNSQPIPVRIKDCQNTFEIETVEELDVLHCISRVISRKAPGNDEITPYVLKIAARVILPHITDIINTSISGKCFPSSWKMAIVKPLPKTDNIEDPEQQRPISLLPILSKVCERLVYDQFSDFLICNDLYPEHQFGGRRGFSAETLVIKTTDTIRAAMASKKLTAMAIIDLSKAFDSVNHSLLLDMLVAHKVGADSLTWFRSYLSGREISTKIGECFSRPLSLSHGIPQGSVFSPLLFNLYTSDMISCAENCSLTTFIDDTTISVSFYPKDVVWGLETVKRDLRNILKWSCFRSMQMNPLKTKLILFGTKNMLAKLPANLHIEFCGQQLGVEDSVRYLGVVLDKTLTMQDHVTNQVRAANYVLHRLSRIRHLLDFRTAKMAVESLALSKLTFGCQCVSSACQLHRLQKVQNYAARIVTGTLRTEHVSPVLKRLGWLRICDSLNVKSLVLLHKSVYWVDAGRHFCLPGVQLDNPGVYGVRLQATVKYDQSWGDAELRKRMAILWNTLPKSIREKRERQPFKCSLKRHFLDKT